MTPPVPASAPTAEPRDPRLDTGLSDEARAAIDRLRRPDRSADVPVDPRLGGMVPPDSVLPDVLPTDRLLANGKAIPEIRAGLRDIPDARAAVAVGSLWAETIAVMAAVALTDHPAAYAAGFVLATRSIVRFNVLGHEAVHRTLFSNKKINDFVGRWLLSYHAFVPFELYRRGHLDHHRDELGPDEPDTDLYANYPITRASLRRKLIRDATGQSGWKIFKGLLRGTRNKRTRPVAARIIGFQVALLAAATALGHPELWLLLWFLPWLTSWRVVNRLRAIAEHGGMTRSPDRRRTTHQVRQGPLSRFFMVPYNVGLHLAHHVDMGVPCWHLPQLHEELVASGWVTDEYEWDSYRDLWRALSARPEPDTATG
ncbi:MAG: fatty acid desaturase [Acidimicrobiales bacterium]